MKLTSKEIGRASEGLTVVVRPQANGKYLVAVVRVETSRPVMRPSIVKASEVRQAIKNDLRMIDKCGFDCPMADASRTRNFCK